MQYFFDKFWMVIKEPSVEPKMQAQPFTGFPALIVKQALQ